MISVIIIVKNDKGIINTLNKLLDIPKPEKTEILVIDASEKNSHNMDKEFPSIRWIYYHNDKNKKITIPEQRNLGIKKAEGEIIVFTDADCVPDNNWLIELIKPIRNEGEYIVSGLIKTLGKATIWDFKDEETDQLRYADEVLPVNMAFRKEIIDKIGMYDEDYYYGSDMDIAWRMLKNGYKIRFQSSAVIYHSWGSSGAGIKRAIRYGEGRAKLYKKHPDMWKNLFSNDKVSLFYPLYILFFPVAFLLIIIPIFKNINRRPFKVVFINLIYGYGILKEMLFPRK